MKKIILGVLLSLLSISCSKSSSDESASNSGVYKWQCKIDGVQYQYSTTTLGAISIYTNGILSLNSGSKPDGTVDEMMVIKLPSVSSGNFIINTSGIPNTSTAPYVSYIHFTPIYTQMVYNQYNTMYGGTMNVNISSLSSNTAQTSPNNLGKVIGTFSGTLRNSPGNKTITITEGSFEALRIN